MRLNLALILLVAAVPVATSVALEQAVPHAGQPAAAASADATAEALYQQHCQRCHGQDRLGGAGPALLPESLARIKPEEARSVIRDGRPASQMAAYKTLLDEAQIAALSDYLYRPAAVPPTWSDADIRATEVDAAALGAVGYGHERLDQLVNELLLGVR